MKKENRLYAMPLAGGDVVCIVAKSIRHMKKILNRTTIIGLFTDFEDWGKFTQLSKEWEIKLKKLVQRSGIVYMDSYGYRHWIKQNN